MKSKDQFPLLTEFARGYMHEDMAPEYGSPEGAARAYIADLSAPEKKALSAEARRMAHSAQEWSDEEANQQLHRMGAVCLLRSRDEFVELLRMFKKAR
jgi:hypothetical protein